MPVSKRNGDYFYIENPYDDFFDIPDDHTFIRYLDITYTNNVHIPYLPNLEVIKLYDSDITIPDGLPNLKIIVCQMSEKIKINLENYHNLVIFKEDRTRILPLNNNQIDIDQVIRNNNINVINLDRRFEDFKINDYIEYCNNRF